MNFQIQISIPKRNPTHFRLFRKKFSKNNQINRLASVFIKFKTVKKIERRIFVYNQKLGILEIVILK